jgi:hypothetical protein
VYLIQMLLPTRVASGAAISDEVLGETRDELIAQFGGVTAYGRSPAAGVWTSPEGRVEQDNVVMVEVLAEGFDVRWWRDYGEKLKHRFEQASVHIRASEVQVLDT